MNATLSNSIAAPRARFQAGPPIDPTFGPKALASLLPVSSDPDYLWMLTELVRSDIESQKSLGIVPDVDVYRAEYPNLFAEPAVARALEELARSTESFQDSRTPPPSGHLDLTRAVSITPVPARGKRAAFPKVGDEFAGFRLVGELGRGAFARVFLAEQLGLADRPVALKVTTRPTREPQRLAKLRHTNIVPIYSVHDEAPLQGVCMPFLGRQTLADLVKEYRETGALSVSGAHGLSTFALAARTTAVESTLSSPNSGHDSGSHPNPAEARPERAELASLSHVELVLWVAARLTEGLAHAHDRGILHLDIKPANVLFADDGQPLLLDFNLSFDVRANDRERAGGTLPYMAPEQLEDYRDDGDSGRIDARTDLFSLGVILFELLTGRHPFPVASDARPSLTDLVEARRRGALSPRQWNAAASPAVEAIVGKLLAPEPSDRYQSAHDLLADLQNHAQNLPLSHAPNRSVAERAAKWRRRNPKLPMRGLLLGAALAAFAFAGTAYRQDDEFKSAKASEKARDAKGELAKLRVDLAARDDAAARTAAVQKAREVLADYGLPERSDWAATPAARRLSADDRQRLGDDLAELARLVAHAEGLNARTKPEPERAEAKAKLKAWTDVAAACASDRPNRPAEMYLEAARLMSEGKFVEATLPLEVLTTKNPGHFAGQFQLAVCRAQLGDSARALERYSVARGLAPDDPRPSFNRGLILLTQGKAMLARAEFDDAIERDPMHAESYRHRAIARLIPDPKGAIEDLNAALEHGASAALILPVRAVVYDKLGEKAHAESDYAEAAKLIPQTPEEHIARGNARVRRKDAAGAMEDFEAAARLNPNYANAWQNQAHVLAEYLNQPAKALEAQNEAVRCAPDFAPARVGRAVLNARQGHRTEAHADAQHALNLSSDPRVIFQAACAYALTSPAHPSDKAVALDLFRKALREGYRDFANADRDPDLTAIRKEPAFRDSLAAARLLVK